MKEKDFQTEFSKWLKYKHYKTGCFELKLTKEKSIPFSAVAPHQKTALYHAKHSNLVYKIPDESFSQKPFDCFMLVMVPAFVVVMFYKRGQKQFYMISIDSWCAEEEKGLRKSITEEDAMRIGTVCELA
jgi:penicillin-binding protein-related factor A (putative recombinase)